MKTLRPKFVVLSGAVIGMVSAAAAYGSVSTGTVASSTPLLKVASVASAPAASLAQCAQGMELEHGVCVVHVEDAVNSGPSSSSDDSTKTQGVSMPAVDHEAEAAEDATEAAEEAAEHATEAAEEAAADATEAAEEAAEHATEAADDATEAADDATEAADDATEAPDDANEAADDASEDRD